MYSSKLFKFFVSVSKSKHTIASDRTLNIEKSNENEVV